MIHHMRAVVQRVSAASVHVDAHVVADLGLADGEQGLLVLVGVTHHDDADTATRLAGKIWQMRILDGERSAAQANAPVLVVSQFTLYADTGRGRRPTWNAAAPRPVAEPLVEAFADALRDLGARVETGIFGAHMAVSLVNDGPVTMLVEI